MPSGAQIVSTGTALVPITVQPYKANVTCFVLPMSEQFDIIFGQNWLKAAKCNIDYTFDRLTCTDHAGRKRTLLPQEHDADIICPIVSAMHLEEGLQDQDQLYIVQVRESDTAFAPAPASQVNVVNAESVPDDAQLHTLLERHQNTFPAELPAKLPPERNVYHTIPLKSNEPSPPRAPPKAPPKAPPRAPPKATVSADLRQKS